MLPSFFNRFSSREKVMILALFCLLLMIFGLFGIKRLRAWNLQSEYLKNELRGQQVWLDSADDIEAQLQEAQGLIDPTATLDAAKLVARIDKIARLTGFNYELSTPKTQSSDLLNLHTLAVNVRQSSLGKLISFQDAVKLEFPYLKIAKVKVTAVPSNPTLLDAIFTVTAFELKSS